MLLVEEPSLWAQKGLGFVRNHEFFSRTTFILIIAQVETYSKFITILGLFGRKLEWGLSLRIFEKTAKGVLPRERKGFLVNYCVQVSRVINWKILTLSFIDEDLLALIYTY